VATVKCFKWKQFGVVRLDRLELHVSIQLDNSIKLQQHYDHHDHFLADDDHNNQYEYDKRCFRNTNLAVL